MIQEKFPGFLHKLYRYASKVVGADAKNTIICDVMNRKAANDFKLCPIRGKLKLNSYHFFRFLGEEGRIELVSWPRLRKTAASIPHGLGRDPSRDSNVSL